MEPFHLLALIPLKAHIAHEHLQHKHIFDLYCVWHWFGNLHHHILIIVFLQGAVYWKRNPKLFQKTNNQTKTVAVGEAWEGHKSLYEGLKKNSSASALAPATDSCEGHRGDLKFFLNIFQTQSGHEFLLSDSKKVDKVLRTLYQNTMTIINQLVLS